ncbi:MAG: HAMP domain-containing sensor histidine kinase, partial [Bdellovibrionota bacterium]
MRQQDNPLVGVKTILFNLQKSSLKKDFISIVFLSSFIPFLISIFLLWFILKDSQEKIQRSNAQFQHTQELEILDSLHKSTADVYRASQSVEMSEYFSSNSETEAFYRSRLKHYLKSLIPYANMNWIVFGSRGNVLFSTNENEKIKTYDIKKLDGASFYEQEHLILLSSPLFYSSAGTRIKKNYAYVTLEIPVSFVQKKYKYLKEIKNLPQDLSALKFKTEFNIPPQNKLLINAFYIYIFIFVLLNLLAVYFGIKLLQEKIINKLKLLTLRVLNDIQVSSKFDVQNPSMQNEIDDLSATFNKYMKYIQFLQYEIEKSSQLAAVGHIAHFITHDLRKPFSGMSLFLEQVEKMQSLQEVIALTRDFKPVFTYSTEYVEHLLREIMEAGTSRLTLSDSVQLENILLKSFSNNISLPSYCEVQVEYQLNLKHGLKVDELRIVRIFTNIILNALEAMNFMGKIWVYASEYNSEFAEVVIGNNNSFIPETEIKNIFEPFYTKNKKNGTGLGLSIAQKIIQLHGGQIYCRSQANMGVEFVMTLPLGLNSSCSQIKTSQLLKGNALNLDFRTISHNKNKDKIILIDDDIFIGRSWKRLVKDAEVVSFLTPEDFFSQMKSEPLFVNEKCLIVSDFHFGSKSEMDFYSFMLQLRGFFSGEIFLCTDAPSEDIDFNFLNQHKITRINKKAYSFSELKAKH